MTSSSSSSSSRVYAIRDGALAQAAAVQAGDIPVYNLKDCAVRIQNPADTARGGDPLHAVRSAIFAQTFTNTVGQVDGTINDYTNTLGKNIPLWLNGDYALRYAGIDRRLRDVQRMRPQENLSSPNSLVAIILPTAFTERGVERIHPSLECERSMQAGGTTVFAYGLHGQVTAVDIIGATASAIYSVMINRDGFLEHWYWDDINGPVTLRAVIDVLSRGDLSEFVGKRFEWRGA